MELRVSPATFIRLRFDFNTYELVDSGLEGLEDLISLLKLLGYKETAERIIKKLETVHEDEESNPRDILIVAAEPLVKELKSKLVQLIVSEFELDEE
jgi:hypothetical protein